MGFVVGGKSAWKVSRFGDLVIAYHWVKGEPAMVLYPNPRFASSQVVPYCLPLQSAHELVHGDTKGLGVNSEVLLQKASKAAELFGRENDYATIRQVADALLRGLDDLLRMPPQPAALEAKERPAPTGELALKVEGKTVFETEA